MTNEMTFDAKLKGAIDELRQQVQEGENGH